MAVIDGYRVAITTIFVPVVAEYLGCYSNFTIYFVGTIQFSYFICSYAVIK